MTIVFDLPLPPFTLEGGPLLPGLHLRGWAAGPGVEPLAPFAVSNPSPQVPIRRSASELRSLWSSPFDARLDPSIPTVLVVHALTADAVAGGEDGWWEPVIGPGRAIDTETTRVLCFNNLGSCYGSFGPDDPGFPRWSEYQSGGPGWRGVPITSWDQARAILRALDTLGVTQVERAFGGSIGGMITFALQALQPTRFQALSVIGTDSRATPWVIGWNQVGREAILADPDGGLNLARQLAHLSYRANPGLEMRQARQTAGARPWSVFRPYAMGSYLAHHGRKLTGRFSAAAYLSMIDAMDHHDVDRALEPDDDEHWSPSAPWGSQRLHDVHCIGLSTDQLFPATRLKELAATIPRGSYAEVASPHGHDAFLLAWDELIPVLYPKEKT